MPTFHKQTHPQHQFPFFALPWELRSKIYTSIIDATMLSPPLMNYHRTDYLHEANHIHHSWATQCQLTWMQCTHPPQYKSAGAQFLRVCQRMNHDLRQYNTDRKASGKPTCRIEAVVLLKALWIPRVIMLPCWPAQGHNVEIHVEISCEITSRSWDSVCAMIARDGWVQALLECKPAVAQRRMTGIEHRFVDHVTFSIPHCMDECEGSNDRSGVNPYDGDDEGAEESEMEDSGRATGPRQSGKAGKVVCAHLLQLVACIRMGQRDGCLREVGMGFVVGGRRLVEVMGLEK